MARKPVCNRKHLDDIDREMDLVPDKEMALKISELYIREREDYLNQTVRTDYHSVEDKYEYDIKVIFNEQDYEWMVAYKVIQPGGSVFVLDGETAVRIRRDNGMVSTTSREGERREKDGINENKNFSCFTGDIYICNRSVGHLHSQGPARM